MNRPDVDNLESFGWLKFTRGMGGFEGGSESVHSLCAWIRHLEEQRRWIPVTEMLPEDDLYVLVYMLDGTTTCGYWHDNDGDTASGWFVVTGRIDEYYPDKDGYITHWQPLPEGPEQKGANDE